jgi:hypothetical protein
MMHTLILLAEESGQQGPGGMIGSLPFFLIVIVLKLLPLIFLGAVLYLLRDRIFPQKVEQQAQTDKDLQAKGLLRTLLASTLSCATQHHSGY